MKILCIGHATYDITLTTKEYPEENIKLYVDGRVECGGGPASNAAYLLGKWGMDTTFVGLIGNDLYGKKIKEEFEAVNVDTKYLKMDNSKETTTSMIIANTTKGTRTILTYKNNNIKMEDIDLDFEPDVILVDNQEPELSKMMLKRYPKAISIMDAGRSSKEAEEISHLVNYVACCHEFAEFVTGLEMDYNNPKTLLEVYTKMDQLYDSEVIITLESHGCLFKKDNKVILLPSIKVTAVDSTGAGDIFHGALTYGLANNYPLEEALKIGNIAGALSVEKVGSRNSIPSKEEMKKYYHEFK